MSEIGKDFITGAVVGFSVAALGAALVASQTRRLRRARQPGIARDRVTAGTTTDSENSDSDSQSESFLDNFALARDVKMVLVVNGGLIYGGNKKRMMLEGKMAAQCCHAAVGCVRRAKRAHPKICSAWEFRGQTKVTLKSWPSETWLENFRLSQLTPEERQAEDAVAAKKAQEAEKEANDQVQDQSTLQAQNSKKKVKKKKKKAVAKPTIPLPLHLQYLREIQAVAEARGIPTYLVKDAGRTQIPPGTTTVLGLGPFYSSVIDEITGPKGAYACKLIG